MRNVRLLLATAAFGATVVAPISADAQSCRTMTGNLVTNCSFENPGVPNNVNYQFTDNVAGWTSTGMFERWYNGFNTFTSKDGVTHLELDSDKGNTTVWQYIATTVGTSYNVTFSGAHRSRSGASSQLQVLIGGLTDADVFFSTPLLTDNNPGQYKWQDYSTTFIATSVQTRLAFRGNGASNTHGDHLDNVSVTSVEASSVPEPSSYALMVSGLIGMAVVARRRKA